MNLDATLLASMIPPPSDTAIENMFGAIAFCRMNVVFLCLGCLAFGVGLGPSSEKFVKTSYNFHDVCRL